MKHSLSKRLILALSPGSCGLGCKFIHSMTPPTCSSLWTSKIDCLKDPIGDTRNSVRSARGNEAAAAISGVIRFVLPAGMKRLFRLAGFG
jgi:hypothetical protein